MTDAGARLTFAVRPEDAGLRLDRFLADRVPDVSRARLQQLVRDGSATVNDRTARPSARLADGDVVAVEVPPTVIEDGPAASADIPVQLVHVDAEVIVVDKPAGQVVHPAAGHQADTLVNALLARFPDLLEAFPDSRPGIVHRLDRDTSGVMVVARTPAAAESLLAQFRRRTVEKVYLAVVRGRLLPPEGVIDAPVGRDPRRRQRMAALRGGRPARTGYRVLAGNEGYTLVEARPRTGRTHQIRVHFAATGHPVAGDPVYGRRDPLFRRQALHAWRLTFDHPADGRRMTFTAPVPDDLTASLAAAGLRWEGE